VPDPASRVGGLTSDYSSGPYGDSSHPDYLTIRNEAPAFAALAAFDTAAAVVNASGYVERTGLMLVSAEFFDLLGLRPAAGRLLGAADARADAPPAVVIGHDFWRRVFDADPAAVGRPITINGAVRTIAGVAPPQFEGLTLGARIQVWAPLDDRSGDARDSRSLAMIGRLREGVGVDVAQAQLAGIAARLAAAHPGTNRGTLARPEDPRPFTVARHTRLPPASRSEVGFISAVLLAAVALVLLIACANVGSLLLARATARRAEVAIRLALGASRGRLLRQMLTESALLGVAGGALGLLVSLWTAEVLPSFFPAEQAHLLSPSIDDRVLAYTMGLALGCSLLFGLAPALRAVGGASALSPRTDLRGATERGTGGVRGALITAQIALAMMLLASAGLLARSLENARNADLGFTTRDAVVASIEWPTGRPPERARAYQDELLSRIRAVPGVAAASLARTLPLSGYARRGFRIDGYQPRPGEDTELPINVVESAYFETLRMPVIEGRAFTRADGATSERVAIVNGVFADRFFGGQAVGRYITDSHRTRLRIVGVVPDGKYRSVQEATPPMVYYPLAQAPDSPVRLVASTTSDPHALVDTIRRTAAGVDADVAIHRVTTLAAHLDEALAGDRLTTSLVAACGAIALLLALVGIYGVVAYSVGRRRREIGVRIALGARPRHVFGAVLGSGARVLLAGIGLGLAGAIAAARLLRTLLYGVEPVDVVTLGSVTALLGLMAVAAAALPARRAVRVDPVVALRD
jgi:predicted permease